MELPAFRHCTTKHGNWFTDTEQLEIEKGGTAMPAERHTHTHTQANTKGVKREHKTNSTRTCVWGVVRVRGFILYFIAIGYVRTHHTLIRLDLNGVPCGSLDDGTPLHFNYLSTLIKYPRAKSQNFTGWASPSYNCTKPTSVLFSSPLSSSIPTPWMGRPRERRSRHQYTKNKMEYL